MITSLDHLPLVCSIEQTADALSRSVRDIERALSNNRMEPAPMPSRGKRQRRQWSKFAIEAWLKGDYLTFVQQAQKPSKRHYFGKASAKVMGKAS